LKLSDIPAALTGDVLLEQISKAKDQRKALVDGLLYEQTIVMVSAPPGLGKSTLATQIAIECAAGIPVFGVLPIMKPLKVLYCQTERPMLEFLERAEIISKTYPIVKENLTVTDAYKIFNLVKEDHMIGLIQCVNRDCPGAEVIFLDPIYPLVAGGLSKDEPASAFCKAISLLQKYTKATIFLNHHTVKPSSDNSGKAIIRDDPFYGSQWLKALVTGSYSVYSNENGVTLIRKKDNYRCLRSEIVLEYDPATELSHIPLDEMPIVDKVRLYLQVKAKDKKEFSFSEMVASLECSNRALRRVLALEDIKGLLEIVDVRKNNNFYRTKEKAKA
jgi:RecA-family ATPase